ncbi:hypothetical protein [Luteolibacter marinus]|uniref:hypothetical protein n=1 Tax=Luteolibacter marinus TaxID=2776705 RepID=UPI0018675B75|nr:hypothetical protein [Luteolibacter marinus]
MSRFASICAPGLRQGSLAGLFLISSLCSDAGAAELSSPSAAAVEAAVGTSLISYSRDFSGGAHTNGAWFGGASITLAVASYAGNTAADARLLQQIRHTLTPGNAPSFNGGYPAQHELHVTGMFVMAKNTPRIWGQLSAAEKTRIDRIMKASLVGNAFTTSDNNPFIKAGSQQYSMDGDDNLNRAWNPNYREGMIGGVLTAMAYFGGPSQASAVLSGYNHSAFVSELAANDLPNIHETFNWKAAHSSSGAPSGSQIEAAVRNFLYYGLTLNQYDRIYERLVTDTYGKDVTAGLNDGAGIGGAGKIAAGADALPNKGAPGMLKEFDSSDANGARSSWVYAFDGYRPHMTNQMALIVSGLWQKGSAIADEAAQLMNVGNTDLWYKAEMGYIGYAKGKAQNLVNYSTYGASRGFTYNRSLWDDVLKPYHDLPGGGGYEPPAFHPGNRIQFPAAATLRASASATAAEGGDLAAGSYATVTGGPIEADGVDWWQIYADGGAGGWIPETAFTAAPSTEFMDSTGGSWQNRSIPSQNGTFTLSFNAWASAAGIDAVTGLSATGASGYTDLAVVVRFSPDGVFDARNGGSYQASRVLAYQPGVVYRVSIGVNMTTHTYSATVTPPGGAPVVIAENFAFRNEQASVGSLANLAALATGGSHVISGIYLSGGNGAPSAPTGLRVVDEN